MCVIIGLSCAFVGLMLLSMETEHSTDEVGYHAPEVYSFILPDVASPWLRGRATVS